ncbi:hypothetical protein QBC40DRAFT_317110 [Triangularia verruculosa]|uniref:Uncharacterized protein n=1 Tax=Triangularia verruculosa TaxID=2587418 RepID=A0AAN7AY97_9PEZI|nr:hypothetical protein QBC40DRAFT_317110 [Triangularia verruculosa]
MEDVQSQCPPDEEPQVMDERQMIPLDKYQLIDPQLIDARQVNDETLTETVEEISDKFRKSAYEITHLALLVQYSKEKDPYFCNQDSIKTMGEFIAAWRIHDQLFPGHGSPSTYLHGKHKSKWLIDRQQLRTTST